MPELPDVEGFRRVLAEHTGEPIRAVTVLDAGVLRDALCGRRVSGRRTVWCPARQPARCERGR